MKEEAIIQSNDYRETLRLILKGRATQNPRYSLRAFARDLDLVPSRLSEIMNKKQGLSRRAAERIAQKLGFKDDNYELFCDSVSSLHARAENERKLATIRLVKHQSDAASIYRMRSDTFAIISDWYHLAILELMKLKSFRQDIRWIATELKVSPIQIELAIDRLLRMKLLTKDGSGKLSVSNDFGQIDSEIPLDCIGKFHRQLLAKAATSLATTAIDKREITSQLMALTHSEVAEVKRSLKKFRDTVTSNINRERMRRISSTHSRFSFIHFPKENSHDF
jgi:uncharacterized protein (TIGR02147 family)